jgi:hypothetical protein
MSHQLIIKLERQLDSADAAISKVLTSPTDAPIWSDETFWSLRWHAMVDRSAGLVDRIAHLRLRELQLSKRLK